MTPSGLSVHTRNPSAVLRMYLSRHTTEGDLYVYTMSGHPRPGSKVDVSGQDAVWVYVDRSNSGYGQDKWFYARPGVSLSDALVAIVASYSLKHEVFLELT